MLLNAPLYYKNFKCIADKCVHGCCSRWEIDIDSNTVKRYKEHGSIMQTLERDADGSTHFKLCKNGNCPHLTDNKLCNLILQYGEAYLCEICREHPRFYNNTGSTVEVGLGASCEEACRLMLECEDYKTLCHVGSIDGNTFSPAFDTISERNSIYALLSDASVPYHIRLDSLYKQYGIDDDLLSNGWQDVFERLEYLDINHKKLFCSYTYRKSTPLQLQKYAERYLAYLIYRHTSTAKSTEDFRSALGFCFLCERLLVQLLGENGQLFNVIEYARIISEELEYSDCNLDDIMLEFDFLL